MKKNLKFKFFIFDLDGVLFDSKKNMKKSWNSVKKKHKINCSFESYFNKIGSPFDKILIDLNIKPNKKISKTYQGTSQKYIDLIKPYPWVNINFIMLNKKKIKFSILTSKDSKRSKFLLKKYNKASR